MGDWKICNFAILILFIKSYITFRKIDINTKTLTKISNWAYNPLNKIPNNN